MIRKLALFLAVVILAYSAWLLFSTGHFPYIYINGWPIDGPIDVIAGVLGFAISVLVLLFVTILLALIFTGVGLLVLGLLTLVALILAAVAFPFLLPLLIPLFIIWIICSIFRRTKPA